MHARKAVETLQGQKTLLTPELEGLKKEKEKLEAVINIDKALLQHILGQALIGLKMQKPYLFTISGEEQMARLLGEFLKRMLT